MTTICQCCKKVIRTTEPFDDKISHGMCIECMPEYLRENGIPEEDITKLMRRYPQEASEQA